MNYKEKILNAVKNIPTISSKEDWVITYDADEGSLFYSPKKIPRNTQLHQITDEYAMYMNKKFVPRGLVIEYYGANFIKHHKKFEKISNELFGNVKSKKSINPRTSKKDAAAHLKAMIESNLIVEADKNFVVN